MSYLSSINWNKSEYAANECYTVSTSLFYKSEVSIDPIILALTLYLKNVFEVKNNQQA